MGGDPELPTLPTIAGYCVVLILLWIAFSIT